MARFLFATMPITGHVAPALPIARRLVADGHDVRWYTGAKFRAKVEATGARYLPMATAPDYDDRDMDRTFAGRVPLEGLAKLKWDIKHVFIDPVPAQVRDLEAALDAEPADALLCDTVFVGGLLVQERRGVPVAYLGILPYSGHSADTAPFGLALPPSSTPLGRLRNRALRWLTDGVIFRDVNAHYGAVRAGLGCRPSPFGFFDDLRAATLYLAGTVPGFDYPRSDLPSNFRFVGPMLPGAEEAFEPPAWWADLDGKTVVHVTQGTIANEDLGRLIKPALAGLAGEDVLVVAATGGKPVANAGPAPANARVVEFIPYAHFMPRVDVYVTNGGYGGVQFALAHGVPIVTCGTTEDKPEINARVAWSGVGIDLKTDAPTPAQLRDAVRRVLAEPGFKARAGALRAEMAGKDAPREAAALLVDMALGREACVPAPQDVTPVGR